MANGICEGIWIKRLLKELGVDLEDPMKLFYDNQSALSIAKNPVLLTGPNMLRLIVTLSRRR